MTATTTTPARQIYAKTVCVRMGWSFAKMMITSVTVPTPAMHNSGAKTVALSTAMTTMPTPMIPATPPPDAYSHPSSECDFLPINLPQPLV